MIKNILLCVLGTIGFSVILNVPRNKAAFVVAGGLLSSVTFELLFSYTSFGVFWSTLIAVVFVEIYSEIMARVLKTPATVILIPSTVPLLPGGYLYYAMSYLISGESEKFFLNAKYALLVAFAIAMGSVIILINLNVIRRIKAVLQ